MESTVTIWFILFNLARFLLIFITPLAGFAMLDLLKCCRDEKSFWLPSKIIFIMFIWSLGWMIISISNSV